MRLDFGGIAKGYAADEAVRVLRTHGIHRALVDAGGDLSLGEPPPGEAGWRIEMRTGVAGEARKASLVLRNQAVATSGDAYQFFLKDGVRYSHIIEPASGVGVKNSPGVTAIAPDGATADALATALSILPVEDGLLLADSIRGASAAICLGNGSDIEFRVSSRFPRTEMLPGQSANASHARRRQD
jgi:thiamine biosynthesis lipoprotein